MYLILFFFILFQIIKHFVQSVEVFKLLKVQITLKQFARDWSDVGAEERRQCYNPIIDEITAFYNPNKM